MNKITLLILVLILGLGLNSVFAETNTDKLLSLSKEIKTALPDIFGQEGFAAATEGSVGFGSLPGGVDIGVGLTTNRDITFAALQTVAPVAPVVPVIPPVTPPQLVTGDYYWDYVTPPEPPKTEDSYLDY